RNGSIFWEGDDPVATRSVRIQLGHWGLEELSGFLRSHGHPCHVVRATGSGDLESRRQLAYRSHSLVVVAGTA
ncbi:hypothetical protein PMAYCL1PPCAC_08410, partial [Pristionchus mayeri]